MPPGRRNHSPETTRSAAGFLQFQRGELLPNPETSFILSPLSGRTSLMRFRNFSCSEEPIPTKLAGPPRLWPLLSSSTGRQILRRGHQLLPLDARHRVIFSPSPEDPHSLDDVPRLSRIVAAASFFPVSLEPLLVLNKTRARTCHETQVALVASTTEPRPHAHVTSSKPGSRTARWRIFNFSGSLTGGPRTSASLVWSNPRRRIFDHD